MLHFCPFLSAKSARLNPRPVASIFIILLLLTGHILPQGTPKKQPKKGSGGNDHDERE
jgi:hypothetical protein